MPGEGERPHQKGARASRNRRGERSGVGIVDLGDLLDKSSLKAEDMWLILGISRSTFFARRAAGLILDPLLLGGSLRRWHGPTVRAWMEAGCPRAEVWRARKGGAA